MASGHANRANRPNTCTAAQGVAARHLASAMGIIGMGDLLPKQFANAEYSGSGLKRLAKLRPN